MTGYTIPQLPLQRKSTATPLAGCGWPGRSFSHCPSFRSLLLVSTRGLSAASLAQWERLLIRYLYYSGDICLGKYDVLSYLFPSRSGFAPKNRLGRKYKKGVRKSGRLSLSKKCPYVKSYARASQSSVVRRRRNQVKSVFSGDMCLGKNTSQAASVEFGRSGQIMRAAACISSKKCLHF